MKRLKKIMTTNVTTVAPNTPLREVAEIMSSEDIGFIPVCDGPRVKGVITDRDLVIRAIADGMDPDECTANDIMTKDVAFLYDDDYVSDAARLMQRKQLRRVLVLDRNRQVAGIVSLGDLAVESGNRKLTARTLERVSSSRTSNLISDIVRPVFGVSLGAVALAALYAWFNQQGGFKGSEKIDRAA